jgi:endonuclease/exonuclease/phosphatase family metal-dependent hydrolase
VRILVALLLVGAVGGIGGCRVPRLVPEEPVSEPGVEPLPVPPPEGVLRVASWNVWMLPFASAQISERLARIPDAIRAHDPHVICLQEVWTPTARASIAQALSPRWTASPVVGGGLLLLARVPIEDVRFVPFEAAPGLSAVERFARKGWIEATVTTDAGPVRIVNTHLALAFGDGTPRTIQLTQLLDALAERDDLPLVLAGDLNTPSVRGAVLDPDYVRVLDAGFVDANPPRRDGHTWVRGAPTRQGWPRWPGRHGWDPDHVLVRSGSTRVVTIAGFHVANATPETALSDHDMLVVDVRL